MAPITEITIAGGNSHRVEGSVEDVQALILAAARGSIMELAWMVEVETGERIGFNPEHVAMLRAIES